MKDFDAVKKRLTDQTRMEETSDRAHKHLVPFHHVLTADEFVAGIVSVLALRNQTKFVLTDAQLDERFERAFADLLSKEGEFNVRTNFSFYVDNIHGDSPKLRDTLLAAKEKELIALNNPTFRTFTIKLNPDRAKRYLSRLPIPSSFLETLVDSHFADLAAAQ